MEDNIRERRLLSKKQQVLIYCAIACACRRAEKQDKQWTKDPNHFLINIVKRIEGIVNG